MRPASSAMYGLAFAGWATCSQGSGPAGPAGVLAAGVAMTASDVSRAPG